MQPLIVTDAKYEFVPPHKGNVWPRLLWWFCLRLARKRCGIDDVEVRGREKIEQLLADQHSLLIAPNHCRMADALVLQGLSKELRQPFYFMASSHLFRGSGVLKWALRRMGAFSVYREGIDRTAIEASIGMLTSGERPMVIFPEGALNQANDHLGALMEGVSFIAHAAARKVQRENKDKGTERSVYVVPIGLRYLFCGDIKETVSPMLSDIEQRLTWRTNESMPLVERIHKLGGALLGLKETEFIGQPQGGSISERLQRLIDHLLCPLEEEWLESGQDGSVVNRVKELRRAIVPDMIEEPADEGDGSAPLSPEERQRRWRQLDDMALAQALSLFPPDYVASNPTVDRILETVERMAENLTGKEQAHPPMKAIVQVGEPFTVAGKRDRKAERDPLLQQLEDSLLGMLADLSTESKPYKATGSESA